MLLHVSSLCLIILGSSLLASGSSGNIRELQQLQLAGKRSNETSKFIVGGREASEGQFPYQVSLRTSWDMHFCGGSILNTRWILSAAHCTWFLEITEIVAGSLRVSEGGDRYAVSEIINHPNYDAEGVQVDAPFIDDICLIKTSLAIQFNQFVQPIPIAGDRVRWRNRALIAGWGWTEGGNHLNPDDFHPVVSENLNFIAVNVLSHFECTWRLSGWAIFLRLDHICTWGGSGVGVCTFDSGSPVAVDGELVGIVSFAAPCAFGFPDWGPRVSSYRSWIDPIVRDLT